MTVLNDVQKPVQTDLLVAFSDLSGFARYARKKTDEELFSLMSGYAELIGGIIEGAGGKVVKFMGDAALIAFPAEKADEGVRALLRVNEEGDRWLAEQGCPCRNVVKAHVGPVFCGPFGTKTEKRFDVYGLTVNTAAMTASRGFAVTPQVFRKLAPETRKLLKKHTPPVTYIAAGERRQG